AGGKRVARRGKRLLLGERSRGNDRGGRSLRRLPERSPCLKQHGVLVVPEACEEGLPFRTDRVRRLLIARVKLLEIGSVRALQKRRGGKHVVQFVPRHEITLPALLLPACRAKKASLGPPAQLPCNTRASVVPRAPGESAMTIPAARIASILCCASPLPPDMTAPAWPMRRPGGALTPAMKPTNGFFVR